MNETPPRPGGRLPIVIAALIVAVIAIPFVLQSHRPGTAGSSTSTNALTQPANPGAPSASGKMVMYDFYTDWCGWCKKLDAEVYPDPAVKREMERFDFRRVNAEQGDENRALAAKYNVTGFPTIVFVDGKGKEVHRIVGYLPAPRFADELKSVPAPSGT